VFELLRRNMSGFLSEKTSPGSLDASFWWLLVGSVFIGGGVGLCCFFLTHVLSKLRFGVDHANKHGISHQDGSRLGGIAIALTLLLVVMGKALWAERGLSLSDYGDLVSLVSIVLPIAFIGFVDDISQRLSSSIRLVFMALFTILGFISFPQFMPSGILQELFGAESDFTLLIFSVFFLVGFINAGNMVDGANGLLSILIASFFGLCFYVTKADFHYMVMLVVAVFAFVNLVGGTKIMLGDFGAFGLSALTILTAFLLYQTHNISIFLYASLLCYPCIEIIRISSIRLWRGKSPLSADNQHGHNLMFRALSRVLHPQVANSLTGVVIASISVAPAWVLLALDWGYQTDLYFVIFLFQSMVYIVGAGLLKWLLARLEENGKRSRSRHEVTSR
jgi:UDP-GlcNAc:undecaprenyl-phosphate/decaprenyl-phosphate GlcNAc-1-phosphate transferase